ncbi:MAG TPA: hypothetical protein VFP06_09610 [Acidimicrobiales bacterium]|nr:hypothetical protein [Acidimicrobiales bacterium]
MSLISDTCGGGDPDRTLVAGSLRGYRTWRLQRPGARRPDGALPLSSVTRRVVWAPALTARCTPKGAPPGGPQSPPDGDHRAPAAGCRCGIYGWYDPTDTGMVSARVFGVIEASGLVLMGERGFRAERARIVAVVSRNRRLTAACERAGIAVYRRRRDLVRELPPEDLSPLLGDRAGVEQQGHPAVPPQVPPPTGFDRLVLAVAFGRMALVAAALVALPTAPAVVVAIAAHLALLGVIAVHVRH